MQRSIATTNRYAEVDLEMKAKALAACAITGTDREINQSAARREQSNLMSFLASL